MSMLEGAAIFLILTGAAFLFAGTIGLLRFPDVYMRLHALTKADTLGLGFIVGGLALLETSFLAAAKLLLIWILAVFASITIGQLIAHRAWHEGVKPWQRR
jgi:multicomponent Na+:H+ antiporter subunit G